MLGIIGEDETDCDTLAELVRRIAGHGMGIRIAYPTSGGCEKMRRKAHAYTQRLIRSGCKAILLVHDCDRHEENALRSRLEAIGSSFDVRFYVCIPVEELEAWFWADQKTLDRIGGPGIARAALSPHAIASPKEKLRTLSRRAHHKAAYSTNQNATLAKDLDLDVCAARCPSFRDLRHFVQRSMNLFANLRQE